MIKIGDKVKFLNDVGGGVVTGYAGKNKVYVENYDGFEIPYLVSQLVNTEAPEMNRAEKTTSFVQKPKTELAETPGTWMKGKENPDFYFCLIPADAKNPATGETDLFLVNDSNFTVIFRFVKIRFTGVDTVKTGTLQPNARVHLGNVLPADLSDLPEFGFQLVYFQQKESNWNEPIVKRFKINPLKFYKETSFQSNSYFGLNAMVLQITANIQSTEMDKITEADFQKMVHEKMDKPVDEKPVRARTPELIEIDLHINELIDNTGGLSNGEILEIQKDKVESEMKAAIQTGIKKIVFIHGVGQGVLKQEVLNLLKTKYKKYYTQDASFREYGFGATMVILRR